MSTTTTASIKTPHHQYHHKKGAQTQSINQNSQLKKQLRDATRSLRRPGIPATVQQELERRVAHLNHLIGRREEDEKEKAIILRYRKVRFFENKKADRHLKQASQKFISSPTTETMSAYLKAKKDSIYCLTFPRTQKYVSLFADSTNDDGSCSKVKETLLEQYSKDLLANIDLSSALQLAKQDLSSLLRKASDSSDDEEDEEEEEDNNDDDDEEDDDNDEEEEDEEEENNEEEEASEDDVSGTEDANNSDPENGSESSGSEDDNGSSASDSDSDSFDSEPSDSESYLTESDGNSDSEFDSNNSDSEDIADADESDDDEDVSGVSSDLSDEESDENSDSDSGSSQKRPSAKKTRKDF